MSERANPNPGPGIVHDFHCTHDPCRCADRGGWFARLRARVFGWAKSVVSGSDRQAAT